MLNLDIGNHINTLRAVARDLLGAYEPERMITKVFYTTDIDGKMFAFWPFRTDIRVWEYYIDWRDGERLFLHRPTHPRIELEPVPTDIIEELAADLWVIELVKVETPNFALGNGMRRLERALKPASESEISGRPLAKNGSTTVIAPEDKVPLVPVG